MTAEINAIYTFSAGIQVPNKPGNIRFINGNYNQYLRPCLHAMPWTAFPKLNTLSLSSNQDKLIAIVYTSTRS